MNETFVCCKCGRERHAKYFYSGKRKHVCVICEAYRKAKVSYSFEEYEAKKVDEIELADMGMSRCNKCGTAKPLTDKWRSANTCWDCFLKHRRATEYARRNARRRKYCDRRTYIARSIERRMRALTIRNAKQAFEYWIAEKGADDVVQAYFDAIGKPWRNPRLSEAERYRIRYRNDEEFAIQERMRNQVRKRRERRGIADTIRLAIYRGGRSKKVERELGYTIGELKRHLERQFTDGMSWEAFMRGEIHIDHIIPQSAFDLSDEDEWRRCWSLPNLRPCWAEENLAKSNKVLTLL